MPVVVETASELDEVIAAASSADRYAIDTEFHRERTYFPQVALVQLGWEDKVVLIDPLAVELKPLAQLLEGPGLCILHAGVQDLEVLDLSTGTIPRQMIDTQSRCRVSGPCQRLAQVAPRAVSQRESAEG